MTPLFTQWPIVDLAISMLLITYASDILSLWVSTLSRNTTTAMTVMPFVLIFQLVFSGGMLTLPAWTEPLTHFTISNPGLKVIAAQADVNHRPYATIANMVNKMRDKEISAEVTLGQALDVLSDADNLAVAQIRNYEIGGSMTAAELRQMLNDAVSTETAQDDDSQRSVTLKDILASLDDDGLWASLGDEPFEFHTTVGEVVDQLAANPDVQAQRSESRTFSATVGELLDLAGEDNVRTFLEEKAAEANYTPDYDLDRDNIVSYWLHLLIFIAAFALLSTITLEFIDKDKR